jgi:hypothetical protein
VNAVADMPVEGEQLPPTIVHAAVAAAAFEVVSVLDR